MPTRYVQVKSTPNGTLQDPLGNVLVGRSVYVYTRDTTTQIQVYSDQGVTPVSQPLISGPDGRLPGFIASPTSGDFLDQLTGSRIQFEALAANSFADLSVALSAPALATLTDVALTSPATNQGLSFNSGTGKWVNSAVLRTKADVVATGLVATDVGADASGAAAAAAAAVKGLPLVLTGAVSATRYVGGTAAAAPTSGTFAAGDFVVTQTSQMYVCTASGTPGTWVRVGANNVFRHSHTFSISGAIAMDTGAADLVNYVPPFFISLGANETSKIVKVRCVIGGGTSATVKLKKNGADLVGFTGMVAGTAAASTTPTGQAVVEDDQINLFVTAISGSPVNLSVTVFEERTTL